VSYLPFDPRAKVGQDWGKRRYAAYVLDGQGKVTYADLGEAASIDHLVAKFREALADPRSDPRGIGRALDERIMQPVRRLLPATRHVMVAPDGALNLVPFAALVDERGSYLIEDWSFSYVSTGRDLVRSAAETAQTAPLVLANPDFGPVPKQHTRTRSKNEVFDLQQESFEPLPETEQEGRAVASSLPGATFFSGSAATTGRLKQVRGPSVLHIATHGFFLGDAEGSVQSTRAFQRLDSSGGREVMPKNPLLRAGLAFASANLHHPGDDGILTALEASSLDLWGTKLVVLSACDTAVGEVKTGDGVYGLRRAFALAGAESLVMSLWSVKDLVTRDLMTAYYRRLASGERRAQGLRTVQVELERNQDYRHPYYWASFVAYGPDAALGANTNLPPALEGGLRLPVQPEPLPRSAALRGCGCRIRPAPMGSDALPFESAACLLFATWLTRRKIRAPSSRQLTQERSIA
jgi:CHAT domain-containing protein